MDGKKFICIYNKYKNLVMDTAYEVLKDYHLAQDVCQEVFFKMSEDRLVTMTVPNEMKRYLRAVAYHRAIDYYRQMKRRSEISLYEENDIVTEMSIEERLDKNDFAKTLFNELEKKNSEWYHIVIHIGLYDEPAEKVARDMGISIGLLRTKYHRAKEWIRKNYKSEYDYFK